MTDAVPPSSPARHQGTRAVWGAVASLAIGGVAAAIGAARLVSTWMQARTGGPALDSWVYQPGWTIVQVALAVAATGAALVAGTMPATHPGDRRLLPLAAAIAAAAILGWSLNDGGYQVIISMYYPH